MKIFRIVLVLALLNACGGAKPATVPSADLIVGTADSSYWVTSGPHGLRMRGVPMLIARVDGRFVEIFSADDDRSYFDAVIVGQRLWSRDILRGDSTVIFADTIVPRFAKDYAQRHPGLAPLGKDEETSDHPRTTVTADIEVLGVFGPYVSFEYRTDMDIVEARGSTNRHTVRRAVLDLRTGKAVTAAELFGADAAGRAEGIASAEWRVAKDSLLALRDRRTRRAPHSPASFAFDPNSFTIDSDDGEPQLIYAVPGEIARGSLSALELQPLRVPAGAWWQQLHGELPSGPDSLLQWKRGAMELVASLSLDGETARLSLRDSTRRDWPVGYVTAPVWRVLWLDASVGADARKALGKAFNDASTYSEDAKIVMAPRRAKPHKGIMLLASRKLR